MEKIKEKEISRIRKILGDKKPKEWLAAKGYIHYREVGWVKESRVDFCVKKGLVKFDKDGELQITQEGCQWDFLFYLGGGPQKIVRRQSDRKQRDMQEVKQGRDNIQGMFNGL